MRVNLPGVHGEWNPEIRDRDLSERFPPTSPPSPISRFPKDTHLPPLKECKRHANLVLWQLIKIKYKKEGIPSKKKCGACDSSFIYSMAFVFDAKSCFDSWGPDQKPGHGISGTIPWARITQHEKSVCTSPYVSAVPSIPMQFSPQSVSSGL